MFAWPRDHRLSLPIGTICLYPGPVAVASDEKNPAWSLCPKASVEPRARAKAETVGPDTAPALLEAEGWMSCDGRALPKAQFHRLHAVIGNLYGGDAETFRLPDLRGVFVRGVDHGAGVDPDLGYRHAADGSSSYSGVGSMQCDALQTHTHPYDTVGGSNTASPGSPAYASPANGTTRAPTDARISSETRPKNVALWFIIRAW